MKKFLLLIAGYLALQGSAACFADDDPPWTLADVSGYVDDAQGALAAATGRVGQFKPSGNPLLKGQGNRSARKTLAKQINALTKGVADADAKWGLGKLSVALTMADTGSKVAGSLSAGDLSGAGAVVVNEGVKTLSTAAGAALGAKSLALAGSFFGPVGTVVGGAVGAAGGAVLGSVGYDLAAGDYLKSAVESGMVGFKPKAGYVDDARDSRKAYLANEAKNAQIKAEDDTKQRQFDVKNKVRTARNRDAGYDPPNGAEVELGGGPATNPPLLPTANEPEKEMPQDVSIPVIPVDCRISITWENRKNPGIKTTAIHRILDGKVSSNYSYNFNEVSKGTGTGEGTIKDNVITAHETVTETPQRISSVNSELIHYGSRNGNSVFILNLDGSVSMQSSSGEYSWRREVIRGEWPWPKQGSNTTSIDPSDLRGTWHIVSGKEETTSGQNK